MPLCLFLSYHPVMSLGGDGTMNFEFSVAEIWLMVFDIVGVAEMVRRKKLFAGLRGKWWVWVLAPVWLTLSVVWSLNTTRGLLTAGLMWAIVIAIYIMVNLRGVWDVEFRGRWWKWFFGSSLVVCGWCILQCILDLVGVSQSCTLLCDGCTYRMFGFPHPNGFAIEPQFMGNLLLAPMMASAWLYLNRKHANKNLKQECSRDSHFHNRSVGAAPGTIRDSYRDCCKNDNGSHSLSSKFLLACFLTTITTLFLTFSRGAIYAGMVGLAVMTGLWVWRTRKWRAMLIWPIVGLAFLFALNLQGMMAQVSGTNDTYFTGIAKVINHLSLGVIDLRVNDSGNVGAADGEEAVFDGYVAESTDTRMRLTGSAVKIWTGDAKTMLIGVGLGGAGQALYDNGLSPAPKEIVQNEYASLLLETGMVGVVLCVLVVILAVRVLWRSPAKIMLMGLIVAYGVSLLFFSGLPNALQIYLMPAVLMVVRGGRECSHRAPLQ